MFSSNVSLRSVLANRLFWVGVGLFVVLSSVAFVFYFSTQPGYAVLFRNLKAAEAATITEDLDKHKELYELADGGATIKVPPERADALKVRLEAGDLPLKGTVGLELFNGSDLGMTDFAQKVNYQRAVQGELVRTISSLSGVESARVHISIPDSTLFRRTELVPHASVVVFMRRGAILSAATVHGVQQIVAASVPEMQADDVVVADASGAAASRDQSSNVTKMDPRLTQKLAVEDYYVAKLVGQLDGMLGKGHAVVAVDALLSRDEKRVTTDQSRSSAPAATGVTLPPLPEARDAGSSRGGRVDVRPLETSSAESSDQLVWKRVEEVLSSPGAIDRLSVSVVLHDLPANFDTRVVRQAIESAAGISATRGDVVTVAVESMVDSDAAIVASHATPAVTVDPTAHEAPIQRPENITESSLGMANIGEKKGLAFAVFAIAMVLAAFGVLIVKRRWRAASAARRRDFARRLKQILAEEVQSA
jgi:flagellar M-ring protein FliF